MCKNNKNIKAVSWMDGISQFQTTQWTQIQQAELSQAVMGELYLQYRKPIYLYLRGRGFNDDKARELIHDFFTDKVLGKKLLQKAKRSKGKFRTFILAAIRNYSIDQYRTEKVIEQIDDDIEYPPDLDEPSKAFNRSWANQIIKKTLTELKNECQIHGKTQHWEVFRLWLIESDTDSDKKDMNSICKKIGIDNASKAYNMISNMKGRFKIIIRRLLQRNVSSEDQIDEEIRSFLKVFYE